VQLGDLDPRIRAHFREVVIVDPCDHRLPVNSELDHASAVKGDSGQDAAGSASFDQEAAAQLERGF